MKCIITNGLVASGLQNGASYVSQPVATHLASNLQQQPSVYPFGRYDGHSLCVDPYMTYNDHRVFLADTIDGERTFLFAANISDGELNVKEFQEQWEDYFAQLRKDKIENVIKGQ